jgi:GntR family transcriptional regulator, arabinose operon transcriptional repressor
MSVHKSSQSGHKYLQVYAALRRDIESGRWKAGEQLPSEAELVRAFGVSRITVTRAVRDLHRAGMVERFPGSGTFVSRAQAEVAQSFGLLIPDLGETEIFEPICQGMMASPLAREHALVWGSAVRESSSREEQVLNLCQKYIGRSLSGVFFAPLELSPSMDKVNHRVLSLLQEARIPVVLLDRGVASYPMTDSHDLVGIDNHRVGHIGTDHLLKLGCRRLAFVGLPNAAPTVDARAAGFREALLSHGAKVDKSSVLRADPTDSGRIKHLMETLRPEGIVCANDRTAGQLMLTLRDLGYHVPSDVRLVGIDDVEYARLLPVPLTTLRQPTREIGDTALELMLARIARPTLPPREVRLGCELVVRESCGSSSSGRRDV